MSDERCDFRWGWKYNVSIYLPGEGSTASTSAEGSSTNDANDAVKSDGAKEVCSIVVADHPTEVERDKRSRSRR